MLYKGICAAIALLSVVLTVGACNPAPALTEAEQGKTSLQGPVRVSKSEVRFWILKDEPGGQTIQTRTLFNADTSSCRECKEKSPKSWTSSVAFPWYNTDPSCHACERLLGACFTQHCTPEKLHAAKPKAPAPKLTDGLQILQKVTQASVTMGEGLVKHCHQRYSDCRKTSTRETECASERESCINSVLK
jgi:hypothetical protein